MTFDFFGVFDVEKEDLVASPVGGGVFRFSEEVLQFLAAAWDVALGGDTEYNGESNENDFEDDPKNFEGRDNGADSSSSWLLSWPLLLFASFLQWFVASSRLNITQGSASL